MIKYLSTGNFWKPTEEPSRFTNRKASRGDGGEMYKRNYEDPSEFNFKASGSVPASNMTHKHYHQINNTYQQKPYYYGTMHSSTQNLNHDGKQTTDQYWKSFRNQNLQEASHLHNWKVVKERKFALYHKCVTTSRAHQEGTTPANQQGQVVDKVEFSNRVNKPIAIPEPKQMLARENLFQISKPLLRLDNDMKSQPLIRNVQTVSDDVPKWCTNTNKFYTPENFDQSKKQRSKKLAPADIFGNPEVIPNKDPNNVLFQDVPSVSQIHEKTRMGIFYENPDKARKKINVAEIKKSHVQLNWQEDQSKQRFEPNLQSKIGWTESIKVKALEQKRDPNFPKVEKIGAPDVYKKLDKDKAIQLKIGHGTPSTLNPVKY